MENGGEITMER